MPNALAAIDCPAIDCPGMAAPSGFTVTSIETATEGNDSVTTVNVVATNRAVIQTVATNHYVSTWAQQIAIQHFKDRIFHSWATSGTSITSATTTNYGWATAASTWSATTSGSSAAANAVWATSAWQNSAHTNHLNQMIARQVRYDMPQRTPEQIAADAAQAELRRQEFLRVEASDKIFRDAAKVRARGLLLRMLNPDQQKEFEEQNRFHLTVHNKDGSMKVYRIEYGYQGNVKLLGPDGKPVKRYCIHSDSRLPYEDQMAAQKMLLEANEAEFLRVANMTQLAA